jgi:diketogulonate reductase-like aldo/keto reductase
MNMKDMVLKGRSPDSRHEKNSQSKLTWEDVDLIRQADEAGYDHLDIACRFGISRDYVGKVVREEVWREEDRV